jgi:tetratricopeptide (TPR) repeat protein
VETEGGKRDIAWLDMERPNICAAIKVASELGINPISWQLAESMLGFIRLHPGGDDWSRAIRSALDAATRSVDRRAHAAMLINVADTEYRTGECEPVLARGREALAASRSAGWRVGEALGFGVLARSYWSVGQLNLADRYLRSARRIHQELEDVAGEANALGRMALNAYDQGRLRDALRDYQRALDLSERAGSRFGKMRAPAFIALAFRDLGLYDEAARWCDLAIGLSREMDFSEGVAIALSCRAAVSSDIGEHSSAVKTALDAYASIPHLADPRIEADCLVHLGGVAATAGDVDMAMRTLGRALRIAEPMRYRQGAARAHAERATAYARLGRYEEAAASCRSARAAVVGDDLRLVLALVSMTEADISLASGRCARAVAGYRAAAAIYHAASHPLGEVRALRSWGRAADAVPGHGRPDRPWRRALRVATSLGVPEADTLRALLDTAR